MGMTVIDTLAVLHRHRRPTTMLIVGEPVRVSELDGGKPWALQGPWKDCGGPQSVPFDTSDGGTP